MAKVKYQIEMEVEAEVGQLFSPIGSAAEFNKVEDYITELIMHDGADALICKLIRNCMGSINDVVGALETIKLEYWKESLK